jgi:hypothetical protein
MKILSTYPLGLVSMDAGGAVNAVILEILDEVVDAPLGLAEDDDPRSVEVLLEDFKEPVGGG